MSQTDFEHPPEPDAGAVPEPSTGAPARAVAAPRAVAPPAAWPRRYAIMSRTGIVGYTDLEFPLEPGARAAGVVVPAGGFRAVHDVFALYHEAGSDGELLHRFVEARDALGLLLTDGGGQPLAARVELIAVSDPRRIVAHVAIDDERYWAPRRAGAAEAGGSRPPSLWSALHTPAGPGLGHGPGAARPTWTSAWSRADGGVAKPPRQDGAGRATE